MQRDLHFRTSRTTEIVDITAEVAAVVHESAVAEGLCNVYVAHATAAIVINENDDPNLCLDFLDALDKLLPQGMWRHDRVDGNGAAHLKSALLGPGETIPVRHGKLVLGRWQAIMLADLDGPRDRKVVVTILGS